MVIMWVGLCVCVCVLVCIVSTFIYRHYIIGVQQNTIVAFILSALWPGGGGGGGKIDLVGRYPHNVAIASLCVYEYLCMTAVD